MLVGSHGRRGLTRLFLGGVSEFVASNARCSTEVVRTRNFGRSDMEKMPDDKSLKTDFIFYPTNKVIGIIDDADDAKAALRELKAAGFTADEITVLTGAEGARRIDVTGEDHGPLARIVRWYQELLGDYEPVHVRRHEQEFLADHYGIGVTAKEPNARAKVQEILKSHKGHFINFYGEWAMEVLEP
jgi:hypothetical protein